MTNRGENDFFFPLSVYRKIKARVNLAECKPNIARAIVSLVKKVGRQSGSSKDARDAKSLGVRLLDGLSPVLDASTFERRGFIILLNECQRLKAMFGRIPDNYKNQLNSVLENYEMISSSAKNKSDYVRGLLLIGQRNLNE